MRFGDFRCLCSKRVRCLELLYNYGEQGNGAAPCVARASWSREQNRARSTQMTYNAVPRATKKSNCLVVLFLSKYTYYALIQAVHILLIYRIHYSPLIVYYSLYFARVNESLFLLLHLLIFNVDHCFSYSYLCSSLYAPIHHCKLH